MHRADFSLYQILHWQVRAVKMYCRQTDRQTHTHKASTITLGYVCGKW